MFVDTLVLVLGRTWWVETYFKVEEAGCLVDGKGTITRKNTYVWPKLSGGLIDLIWFGFLEYYVFTFHHQTYFITRMMSRFHELETATDLPKTALGDWRTERGSSLGVGFIIIVHA